VRPALALSLLLFLPVIAYALTINEMMYDLPGSDTDREWIELYQETGCVNLSGWKLFEAETNHRLTLAQGDWRLCDGGFAVIAQDPPTFLADHPNWSGTLLDSSFSLSNTGEAIAMKDPDGNVSDSVTYISSWGAAGNGKTLEHNASGWYESLINGTPGAANSILPQQGQQQPPDQLQQPSNQQSGQQQGPQQQTSANATNATVSTPAPAGGNLDIGLLNPPAEVESGSSFVLHVKLFNNFSFTKKLEVSSYALSGQSLATEGGWKPNTFAVVLGPGEARTIDLLNEIKPDASGAYKLRARAFDGNLTWDTEVPLNVVEPETEPEQLAQPDENRGPTGAFVVGNVDLVQAITNFFGNLWAKLTALLPLI
jgi:hypothetical protein